MTDTFAPYRVHLICGISNHQHVAANMPLNAAIGINCAAMPLNFLSILEYGYSGNKVSQNVFQAWQILISSLLVNADTSFYSRSVHGEQPCISMRNPRVAQKESEIPC